MMMVRLLHRRANFSPFTLDRVDCSGRIECCCVETFCPNLVLFRLLLAKQLLPSVLIRIAYRCRLIFIRLVAVRDCDAIVNVLSAVSAPVRHHTTASRRKTSRRMAVGCDRSIAHHKRVPKRVVGITRSTAAEAVGLSFMVVAPESRLVVGLNQTAVRAHLRIHNAKVLNRTRDA